MSLDSESNQRFSCTLWHLRLASLRDRPLAIARVIPHTRPTKLPRLKPLPDQSSGMGPTERLTTGGFDDPVRIGPSELSIQGYMFAGCGFMVATVMYCHQYRQPLSRCSHLHRSRSKSWTRGYFICVPYARRSGSRPIRQISVEI